MNVVATMLAAAALWAAPDARDKGADRVDVSSYPPEQQKQYALFSARCSKCHTLARPLNADFSPGEWKIYVRKMIRRPDSGINEEEGQNIYEFLKLYAQRKAGK